MLAVPLRSLVGCTSPGHVSCRDPHNETVLSGRQSLLAKVASSGAIVMVGMQREECQDGVKRSRRRGVCPRRAFRKARRIDRWKTMESNQQMSAFV